MTKTEFFKKYKKKYANNVYQALSNAMVNQALLELYSFQTIHKPTSQIRLRWLGYLMPRNEEEKQEQINRIIYEVRFLLDDECKYKDLEKDLATIKK